MKDLKLTSQEEIEALWCVANGYEPYLAINKDNGIREVYSSHYNYLKGKLRVAGVNINRDYDEWNAEIEDHFIDITPFDKTLYYVDYNKSIIYECTITALSKYTGFEIEQVISDMFDFNYYGLAFVNDEDAINHYKEKFEIDIFDTNDIEILD